ncbi:MAG TPA: hypothetical protein PLP39_05660 [Flavobacterium lutivivi]|nr:hypothetical protein [Flavobacterium lutivivi]
MSKKITLLFALYFLLFLSCSDANDKDDYEPISPVSVDLTKVPYPKLSDYNFFKGELKNLTPELNVLLYEPISSLFSDYAHKKRFIWIPKGSKATYDGDAKIIQMPVGSAIIKNFYYENVQPNNDTKIIETRIMIKKVDGWIFANYVWNDEQTEAFFDLNGSNVDITWKDETNNIRQVNYRIPSEAQCMVCHKFKETVNGNYYQYSMPIGIKPQNLNSTLNYDGETKNQLLKWIEVGYLEDNFTLPSQENTVVNYNDIYKSIELRVRSYFDINCAHCHSETGHCDYRPMRFPFSETKNNLTNMGVCVNTQDLQDFPQELNKIVTPKNINESMLFYRINTTNEAYRMPLHGRTLIHTEGALLIKDWINSLENCN